jgi:RNA recognition motif-containing protein
VANLPLEVDNELITTLFGEYGKIERIVLSKNLPTAVPLPPPAYRLGAVLRQ